MEKSWNWSDTVLQYLMYFSNKKQHRFVIFESFRYLSVPSSSKKIMSFYCVGNRNNQPTDSPKVIVVILNRYQILLKMGVRRDIFVVNSDIFIGEISVLMSFSRKKALTPLLRILVLRLISLGFQSILP